MKKMIRTTCFVLVLCLLCGTVASAETEVTPRGNSYIAAHNTFLYKTASDEFQIWFDVTANAMDIDMIGVTEIEVYRSWNRTDWIKMTTYSYEDYPEMMDYNTGSHTGYVTFNTVSPYYYYKAYVAFYAANSSGAGSVYRYTAVLAM